MKIIVAFSGGKDSLATLIWAINKYGKENIQAVFCDTGWEHKVTYEHIEEVIKQSGVKLDVIKSIIYNGFLDLVFKKKRFPSVKARFCTEELKVKPMVDYVLDINEHCLILQGIRREESVSRSKMDKECRFFKYYLQSYGKDKYHTYRKKDVLKFVSQYSDDILKPVFHWSSEEVMKYIIDNGYKPNPLYYVGMKRVGCFPCIMCSGKELVAVANYDYSVIKKIAEVEKKLKSSWIKSGVLPKDVCEISHPKVGKTIAYIEKAIKYFRGDTETINAFENDEKENKSCMSIYNICE